MSLARLANGGRTSRVRSANSRRREANLGVDPDSGGEVGGDHELRLGVDPGGGPGSVSRDPKTKRLERRTVTGTTDSRG